jgi:hypothetical protein
MKLNIFLLGPNIDNNFNYVVQCDNSVDIQRVHFNRATEVKLETLTILQFLDQ